MFMSPHEKGGRGRSRSVMADLNLVPYIDLLTCMISFLLITAVWTQLSALKVRQHGPGDGTDTAVSDPFTIVVIINQNGFVVVEGRQDHQVVPLNAASLDYNRLTRVLESLKGIHPDATGVQVAPEDDVAFDTIVKTMDAVLTSGFPDVSLADPSPGAMTL
jgi:biopolymer transport protein TolR